MAEKRLIDANVLRAVLKNEECDCEVFPWAVDNAPTVDAEEVVHGRWIDRPSVEGQVYCSECATIEKSTDSNYKSRRCPGCGAKMDGGTSNGQS